MSGRTSWRGDAVTPPAYPAASESAESVRVASSGVLQRRPGSLAGRGLVEVNGIGQISVASSAAERTNAAPP